MVMFKRGQLCSHKSDSHRCWPDVVIEAAEDIAPPDLVLPLLAVDVEPPGASSEYEQG
jgi:hypothetical protein